MRALWYDKRAEERKFQSGTILLKAKVKANENIDDILKVLNLDDNILQNEFYDTDGNLVPLELYWEVQNVKETALVEKSLEINTFPNPFENELTFDINSPVTDKATITISSLLTGQNIVIQKELTKGLNTINITNTSALPAGILTYTIRYSENQIMSGHITKLK